MSGIVDAIRDHPGTAIALASLLAAVIGGIANWIRTTCHEKRRQIERAEDNERVERQLAPNVLMGFEVTRQERNGFDEYYLSVIATNVGQPDVLILKFPKLSVAETAQEIPIPTRLWTVLPADSAKGRSIRTSRSVVFIIPCALVVMHAESEGITGLLGLQASIATSHGRSFESDIPFPFSFDREWPRTPIGPGWGLA